jgi:hypothetical protein
MRFLTDQDVYQSTIQFLIGLGHDVVTAGSLGMAKMLDGAPGRPPKPPMKQS